MKRSFFDGNNGFVLTKSLLNRLDIFTLYFVLHTVILDFFLQSYAFA